MKHLKLGAWIGLATLCLLAMGSAFAQKAVVLPSIHFIWFGGDDCPPCKAWRIFELPKLQATAEFRAIKYSFVIKVVKSPIPSTFFLPDEVKPLKEKLDYASNRRKGSPQAALVVDGEVYDYFRGTRSAEQILRMISSVRDGTPYPFVRCLRGSTKKRKCEIEG